MTNVDEVTAQVTAQVARDFIAQLAPHELPLFRATSAAFFKDPRQVLDRPKGKDDMLGFGEGQEVNLITPAVLATVSAVVAFVAAELKASAQQRPDSALNEVFDPVNVSAVEQRRQLRNQLVALFSLDELTTLCADLGVDAETIKGTDKETKAREMIAYFERRGRLADLLAAGQRERPAADWTFAALAGPVQSAQNAPVRPATLTAVQLAKAREIAIAKAAQLALPADRAALLADSLVVSLAGV